jgi:hypothetical protein
MTPTHPTKSPSVEKKVILTKGRLKALDLALTMDDILYEKYKRIMERIHQAERRLHRKSSIARVIQVKGNINYVLMVDKVFSTEDGTIVYVK